MSTIKDQEKLWVSAPIQNPLLVSFPSDARTHTQTSYHVVCVYMPAHPHQLKLLNLLLWT